MTRGPRFFPVSRFSAHKREEEATYSLLPFFRLPARPPAHSALAPYSPFKTKFTRVAKKWREKEERATFAHTKTARALARSLAFSRRLPFERKLPIAGRARTNAAYAKGKREAIKMQAAPIVRSSSSFDVDFRVSLSLSHVRILESGDERGRPAVWEIRSCARRQAGRRRRRRNRCARYEKSSCGRNFPKRSTPMPRSSSRRRA